MTKRILHISKHPNEKLLFASDFNGRLHQLTPGLELIKTSDPLPGRINSIYAIACNERYVYGRDMQGNLIQWYADSLKVRNIVFLKNVCDEEKRKKFTPIPTVSHGLFLWEDRVLVASPYGDLLQFEQENLDFIKTTDLDARAFAESLDTSIEDAHVVSDCSGYAWFGHVDTGFNNPVRLDFGPIHCLRYDKRHHRYWMTTDNHRGFSIVDTNGENIRRFQMTTDDCEWIAFNEDQSCAYIACFDHHLYVYNNEGEQPELIRKAGPFKFQLKQVLHLDNNHIYVLLESGEIYRLDDQNKVVDEAPFGTNCVWDIVQDPNAANRVFCPMEDGGLTHIEYDAAPNGRYRLNVVNQYDNFGFGRVRRVKPLSQGGFVIGCTDGTVAKVNQQGGLDWIYKSRSIVRDIAVDADEQRALAVNEAGEVMQFDVISGEMLWQDKHDKPLWAACYYGQDMLISERCMSDRDEGQESTAPFANLYRIDGATKEYTLSIELNGNVKRIKELPNGHILFNGNGDVSAIEFDLDKKRAVHTWSTWQLNTCEDAIKCHDHIYTVTYGYQLNTYKENGEMLDCQFSPDNYPKAVYGATTEEGVPILLVAGRGPFVTLYHVREGIPDSARTLYVQ